MRSKSAEFQSAVGPICSWQLYVRHSFRWKLGNPGAPDTETDSTLGQANPSAECKPLSRLTPVRERLRMQVVFHDVV